MNVSKVKNRLIFSSKYTWPAVVPTLNMKFPYHLIDHMKLRHFLWESKGQKPTNLIQKKASLLLYYF